MKVYQFVYTKVPKEESPWRKADFHTVFYPVDLINKEELFEIEKRIYFPGGTFERKETIFFQKIREEHFLIILHIKNLPEEKDTFGRGGIFICHGFLFPEELWRKYPSFLSLFEPLKDFLFEDRKRLLSSHLINRNTGDIQPLEISSEKVKEIPRTLPKLTSDFELKMVILFNKIASPKENRQTVLLKGEPKKITYFMDKILAYVPDDIKVNLGFDPAFDGGGLPFYPLKIVGYSESLPTGGSPIKIDLENFTIDESVEIFGLFTPSSSYERWLYHCREANSKEQVERAYTLSVFLDKGLPGENYLDEKKCFCSVNKDLIIDRFQKRLENLAGTEIIEGLKTLPADLILNLLIEDIPLHKLANHIEDLIIKKSLPLSSSKSFMSRSIVQSGSPRLRLIEKLWREGIVEKNDFFSLPEKERIEFARYLVKTGFLKKNWMKEFLNEEIFVALFSSYDTKEKIENFLKEIIGKDKEIKEIGDIFFKEILNQKGSFLLLKGTLNYIELIEKSLETKRWEKQDLKRLLKWLEKRGIEKKEKLTKLILKTQNYKIAELKPTEKRGQIIDIFMDKIKGFLKGHGNAKKRDQNFKKKGE